MDIYLLALTMMRERERVFRYICLKYAIQTNFTYVQYPRRHTSIPDDLRVRGIP